MSRCLTCMESIEKCIADGECEMGRVALAQAIFRQLEDSYKDEHDFVHWLEARLIERLAAQSATTRYFRPRHPTAPPDSAENAVGEKILLGDSAKWQSMAGFLNWYRDADGLDGEMPLITILKVFDEECERSAKPARLRSGGQ